MTNSHSKEAPTLPVIVDEAGDTPSWVPAIGLAAFVLIGALIALRMAPGNAPAAEPTPTAEPAPAAAE